MRKELPGQGVVTGRVVAYKHNLYQVRYEDEDEEEMTREELLEFLVADEEGSDSGIEKDDEHERRCRRSCHASETYSPGEYASMIKDHLRALDLSTQTPYL